MRKQETASWTDSELIDGCLAGNRVAQEILYRKYKSILFGVCLRYAFDRDEAQDILQEGFIKIFTKLHQFKQQGSLEGWLRRIMVHTAIEFYRKKQRQVPTDELIDTYHEDARTSLPQYGDMEVIIDAIQKLPTGCRTVFNLFAIEGYSHKEIGQLLEISEGASRAQLAYAKKKLSEFFLQINSIPHVVS